MKFTTSKDSILKVNLLLVAEMVFGSLHFQGDFHGKNFILMMYVQSTLDTITGILWEVMNTESLEIIFTGVWSLRNKISSLNP